MTAKERFNLRMQVSGGTLKNEHIMAMRYLIDSAFADDPSYKELYLWRTKEVVPARVYEHKFRDAGTPRRQIQTSYDTPIAPGMAFIIKDKEELGVWMCVEAFDNHGSNYQGTLEYCNYILKFMLNGVIQEYPVITKNATQYNSGETNKSQMTLGSSQHLVYITYDEVTIKIDNGARFLIDRNRDNPTAYKLTQVDSTSHKYLERGLLQWTLVEDQFSKERDNKDLMVADYYVYKEDDKNLKRLW